MPTTKMPKFLWALWKDILCGNDPDKKHRDSQNTSGLANIANPVCFGSGADPDKERRGGRENPHS